MYYCPVSEMAVCMIGIASESDDLFAKTELSCQKSPNQAHLRYSVRVLHLLTLQAI